MQVQIDIALSTILSDSRIDIEARLGQPAKSFTLTRVPAGVNIYINWLGTWVRAIQGAYVGGLDLKDICVSTDVISSDFFSLIVSTEELSSGEGAVIQQTSFPNEVGYIFNQDLPDIGDGLFAINLTGNDLASVWSVFICMAVEGQLIVQRTNGGVTVEEYLNGGNSLAAGLSYAFDVAFMIGDSINFSYSATGGKILSLCILQRKT